MSEVLAKTLADFVVKLQYSDIPADVIKKAKLSTMDNIGVMIRAWEEPNVKIVLELLRRAKGTPESTVLVYGDKVPVINAAFLNAIMCHSLELDDHVSHKRSMNHPGVVSIPPALAVGEHCGISGEQYLLAVVLGYDVTCRINNAVTIGFFNFERGFHGTGICGTFGSAALTGKIIGMNADQIATAFGICGSLTSGSSEYKATGAWTKRMHAGNSSKNGILAAYLAEKGYTGPHTVFEGGHGFFNNYAGKGNYDLSALTRDIGTDFEIRYIQYKPYSCAGVLHSPITAVKKLIDKYQLKPDEIQRLQVFTSAKMVKEFCEPREQKSNPKTSVDAQFSLIYALAALVCRGNFLIDEYAEDALKDPVILNFCKKIEYFVDPIIDKAWPQDEPTKIVVTTNDGRELSTEVMAAKGSLEDPMTEQELKEKFRLLTKNILTEKAIEDVINTCMNLEKIDNIKILIDMIQQGLKKPL